MHINEEQSALGKHRRLNGLSSATRSDSKDLLVGYLAELTSFKENSHDYAGNVRKFRVD